MTVYVNGVAQVGAHTIASHSDTTGTGAELEELTDGSETTLHSHAGGGAKVLKETRDLSDASGDVSYTGYGFQPTGLIIIAAHPVTGISVGSSEPGATEHAALVSASSTADIKSSLVYVRTSAAVYQNGVLKTYDADGFTITWVKGGTGSGTINLHVFAFP